MERTIEQTEALKNAKKTRSAVEVSPEYVKELFGKIEDVVKQIQFQKERYDELNAKLKVFETSKADKEVGENLLKELKDWEAILSCVPGYKTDAIYRVQNMDRYDDRLIVESNLIESYDLLMEFIAKHTNDKFFLIDNVNMSVRSAIAREIVSNLLVHREFGNAFPAKLIIEKDKIYTENWNRAQRIGRIELKDFAPYPKNPILANFFVNIGYADSLGSGVRNLYKFTKIYSGGEPDFEEGDVFKLTVPLEWYHEFDDTNEMILKDTKNVEDLILKLINKNAKITQKEMQEEIGVSLITIKRSIAKMQKEHLLEREGSNRNGTWRILQLIKTKGGESDGRRPECGNAAAGIE